MGDATGPGDPLAGASIDAVATGPMEGAVDGAGEHPALATATAATTASAATECLPGSTEPHVGAIPVPLLPGLTAGSPAAHLGQPVAPGS